MSLNLGTEGVNAARNLANSGDFVVLLDAIMERADAAIHVALDMEGGSKRDDAIGYAKALRDIWIALQSARSGIPYRQTKKPSLAAGVAPNLPASR